MSLQAVCKHLKVLEGPGSSHQDRSTQYRPCHLEPAPLDDATDWIVRNRRIWTERFDRLERRLERITHDTTKEREP